MLSLAPHLALLYGLLAASSEPSLGAKVYRDAVPSVVWIHSSRPGALATGSGSLIDRERKLILTNYHVVEENPRATVFFPVFQGGQPVPEKSYYTARAQRLGIPGRVIAIDKAADLAIIQASKIPNDVQAIPLAPTSPVPGDTVHSIGNAGGSGALWGYVKGTVRQVYQKKWKAQLAPGRSITFEAKVVETDSATNHGDSGGPLLNDRGELVGVTEGGAVNAQLISTFVDVSEVKKLLATLTKSPSTKQTSRPLTVVDNGRLFSADTISHANRILAELHNEGCDILVETYSQAPADWIETARQSADERQRLFRAWAQGRMQSNQRDGIAILICLDPRYVVVEVSEGLLQSFPDGFASKAADLLITQLRNHNPNEGLLSVLKLARDSFRGMR